MIAQTPIGLALCACLLPLPAAAQLTASELATLWQSGDAVRVEAQMEDNATGLTLTDVAMSLPEGDGGAIRTDSITLTDRDDGTVAIVLATPLELRPATLPDDTPMIFDLTGATVTADRRDGRIIYRLDDETTRISLDGSGPDLPTLDYAFRDISARIETGPALADPVTLTTAAARVEGAISLEPQPEGAPTRVALTAGNLDSTSRIDTATGLVASLLSSTLPQIDGTSRLSDLQIGIDAEAPSGRAALGLDIATVAIESASADNALATDISTGPVTVALAAPGLPTLSPAATIDALTYDLTLPVVEGVAAPLALRLSVETLAPAEQIWSLIDPEGVLPRDPADLTLDLTARATPTAPVLAPQTPTAPGFPFDVSRLSLEALDLSALGARLTGSGAVSDPLDPTAANGEIVLLATGLLDAIAALAELGLLPPQQELGARFALGFATVPNPDGPGLRSTITFRDGAIRLNDQPMRP